MSKVLYEKVYYLKMLIKEEKYCTYMLSLDLSHPWSKDFMDEHKVHSHQVTYKERLCNLRGLNLYFYSPYMFLPPLYV